MGIFKAVRNKNQTVSDMKFTIKYITNPEKTTVNYNISLNSGVNCNANTAFEEMMITKNQFRKADKRMFYQFVQSYSNDTKLTPLEIHNIGVEFAKIQFSDYEVLVSTHANTDNVHNHILVNSVSFKDGKKLHQNHSDLVMHRKINDELSLKYGEHFLKPYEKGAKHKSVSTKEYRSAIKGESYKFELMNTIDECMNHSKSKDDFIQLMNYQGYEVLWTDSRKYITYTTPTGKKSRCNKLHESKYLKENMENEFRIREQIIDRGLKKEEQKDNNIKSGTYRSQRYARNFTRSRVPFYSTKRVVPTARGDYEQNVDSVQTRKITADSKRYFDTTSNDEQHTSTGWEEYRQCFYENPKANSTYKQSNNNTISSNNSFSSISNSILNMGKSLTFLTSSNNMNTNSLSPRVESKLYYKIKEKKIAQGHNEKDNSEHDFDLTM